MNCFLREIEHILLGFKELVKAKKRLPRHFLGLNFPLYFYINYFIERQKIFSLS